MYLDRERTFEEFARLSREDAESYRRLLEEWDEIRPLLGKARGAPIGYGTPLKALLAEHPRGGIWARRMAMSAKDVILREFSSKHMRAFMGWMAFQTAVPIDQAGNRAAGLPDRRAASGAKLVDPGGRVGAAGRCADGVSGAARGGVPSRHEDHRPDRGGGPVPGRAHGRWPGVPGEEGGGLDHPRQASGADGDTGGLGRGVPFRGRDLPRGRAVLCRLPRHHRPADLRDAARAAFGGVGGICRVVRGSGPVGPRHLRQQAVGQIVLAAGRHADACRSGPGAGGAPYGQVPDPHDLRLCRGPVPRAGRRARRRSPTD